MDYIVGFVGSRYALACRMIRALRPYRDFKEVRDELAYWHRVKVKELRKGQDSSNEPR